MARQRRLTVSLPDVVLDALCAEAGRRFESPAVIAAHIIREGLPAYVARVLRKDLNAALRERFAEHEDWPSVPQSANDAEAAHLGVVFDHPPAKGRSSGEHTP